MAGSDAVTIGKCTIAEANPRFWLLGLHLGVLVARPAPSRISLKADSGSISRANRSSGRSLCHVFQPNGVDFEGQSVFLRTQRLVFRSSTRRSAPSKAALGTLARHHFNGAFAPSHRPPTHERRFQHYGSSNHRRRSPGVGFNPFDTVFMNDPDAVLLGPVTRVHLLLSILGAGSSLATTTSCRSYATPNCFCSKDILSITELLSPEVIELFGDEIPMEGTLIGRPTGSHPVAKRHGVFLHRQQRGVTRGDDPLRVRRARRRYGEGFGPDLLSQFSYPLPLRIVALLLACRRRPCPRCVEG